MLSAWSWPLPLWLAGAALLAVYLFAFRPHSARGIAFFCSGLFLLVVTLASPLSALARQYVLSAEVVIHVIASLVVPLLLIAGLSNDTGGAGRAVFIACAGWIVGMLAISVWYIPLLFNRVLNSGAMWAIMQGTLILGGAAFWWPILCPNTKRRIKPVPTGIWYLLAAMIWCSFVGMILAFTKPGQYQPYVQPRDTLGILAALRDQWQLSRSGDQETAGLLFWIGTMAVYLSAVLWLFYRWYTSPEMRRDVLQPSKKAREEG